jgi:hypothetical protein
MRDRPATRSGYRPFIWCLLMIAALLGTYAVVRPVLALGAGQAATPHVRAAAGSPAWPGFS